MEEQSSPSLVRRISSQLSSINSRVSRWPWWVMIILIGLALTFYSMATSRIYRDAVAFITGNPQIITDKFVDVRYSVRGGDGQPKVIDGILTSETQTAVNVITTEENNVAVPPEDQITVSCDAPAANGSCPVNSPVKVVRGSITGELRQENLGSYDIETSDGKRLTVLKIDVATRTGTDAECAAQFKTSGCNVPDIVRIPANCTNESASGCQVKLILKRDDPQNVVSGLLTASDPAGLMVQTSPRVTTTINKADILQTINYATNSRYCAVNNLASCNEGIFLTIDVTLAAFLLAVVLGLIFGLMRVSSNVVFYQASTLYVEVIRGVPLLVILLFSYFVFQPWFHDNFPNFAPQLIQVVAGAGVVIALYYLITRWPKRIIEPFELIQPLVLTAVLSVTLLAVILFFRDHSNIDAPQTAILGLAIGYGAFLAELFRAGIQSIGHGQMEAARSLGMTYPQAMRVVILPQAFRVVLPPLGNDFIAMLKDTSLIAVLGVAELTQKSRLYASAHFLPFPSYITIGVIYLCMTLILSFFVRRIEKSINMHRQQAR